MKKFVWDTSAIMNIKEPDSEGYSAGYSLWKDLSDGIIEGPYLNILPAIAYFEVQATVSRKHREGSNVLREFYILGDSEVVYPIDHCLMQRATPIVAQDGFEKLRGADLIFACIAKVEAAWLVTFDKHLIKNCKGLVDVIDLNESRERTAYLRLLR